MPVTPCTHNTNAIELDLDDSDGGLVAHLVPSAESDNGLTILSDGAYVPDFQLYTSLPTATRDMQRIILHDDTQDFHWPLIYISTLGQWIPLGACADINMQLGQGTIASSGGGDWADLSGTDTAGPKHTVRADGSYIIDWGGNVTSTADGDITRIGLSIAGADPTATNVISTANAHNSEISGSRQIGNLSAGNVLQLLYNSSGTGTATFARRWMKVTPLRLG